MGSISRSGVAGQAATSELRMFTFVCYGQLSTLGNLDDFGRLVACALWRVLNLLHNLKAFKDFAKDNVTTIEPPIGCQVADHTSSSSLKATYEVTTVVMKNCDPFVSLPELAMPVETVNLEELPKRELAGRPY